jgi:hypothetical protein
MRLCSGIMMVLLVVSQPAQAADKAKARAAYGRATQDYDLGEYTEALDEFKEAYRQYEDPSFLFNIGQCHRQLGDKPAAVRAYRTYLIKLPNAPNRALVLDMIAKLEKSIDEEQATKAAPPQGTMTPSGETPPEPEPAVAAPAPVAAEPVVARTAPPPHTPVYKKWWLWTIVGVVVVGAAVGIGVGVSQTSSTPTFPGVTF